MGGSTNIHVDPNFANPVKGDFHLNSVKGRYLPVDPNDFDVSGLWVLDKTMSPCIDAGNPYINPNAEPESNGGRVNIGAYGNTEYASRGVWLAGTVVVFALIVLAILSKFPDFLN